MGRATFTAFTNATESDWLKIASANEVFKGAHVDRILTHLNLLKGDCGGFPIDRLEHSLQTATRAHKAGMDEEYVVCALIHDIGDTLGVYNHPGYRRRDPQAVRVGSRTSGWCRTTASSRATISSTTSASTGTCASSSAAIRRSNTRAQFCHLYDQPAFDKDYESMPLSAFEPMLRRVMAAPKNSIYLKPDGDTPW